MLMMTIPVHFDVWLENLYYLQHFYFIVVLSLSVKQLVGVDWQTLLQVMLWWVASCTYVIRCELCWLQLMQSNVKMADAMATTTKVQNLLYYLHNLV